MAARGAVARVAVLDLRAQAVARLVCAVLRATRAVALAGHGASIFQIGAVRAHASNKSTYLDSSMYAIRLTGRRNGSIRRSMEMVTTIDHGNRFH
jgi:hypothetical protein